jgi:AraC family transcriptional regulator
MSNESAIQPTSNLRTRSSDFQTLNVLADAHPSLSLATSATERVGHLVRRAMNFLESDRDAAWRCLQDASLLLESDPQDAAHNAPAIPSGFQAGGLARWQAKRALAYIEANLGSRIETCELAGLVSCSKGHFSRAFKRSLGLPPMAYVATRRVERAKRMMTTTREQLTEIALACGFADQSHLNRSFRRVVGMSPGLWRRTAPETLHTGVRAATS